MNNFNLPPGTSDSDSEAPYNEVDISDMVTEWINGEDVEFLIIDLNTTIVEFSLSHSLEQDDDDGMKEVLISNYWDEMVELYNKQMEE